MIEYLIHPIAKCYPKITGSDYKELRKSIKEQGLLNPITLFQGMILDGSNRYRACVDEGVEAKFRELPEGADPIAYVISQNESRRHLTIEQRAFIGAKLAKLTPGGDRRGEGWTGNGNRKSTEAVAKELKISSKSIERAKRVQAKGTPEVVEAAESGEVNLSHAERIVALPKEQQGEVVQQAKSQKAAIAKAKDVTQSDEFKGHVSKYQGIVDTQSLYPIDLEVPDEHLTVIKALRAYETRIPTMDLDETGESKHPHEFADKLSKDASVDKRFTNWANSIKRKLAARRLILEEARSFRKAEKAEKTEKAQPKAVKKIALIDRQWQVFVPQFQALMKLFEKKDRTEIRRRIDELLDSAGWPTDSGVVVS